MANESTNNDGELSQESRRPTIHSSTTSLNIRTVDIQRGLDNAELTLKEPSADARLGAKVIEDQRFEYVGKIGQGATANVYEFVDKNTCRKVAIKTPKEVDPAEYRAEMERFIEETKVTAKLEHPAIIPIYELNVDDNGRLYMCMRRVRGYSLRHYIDTVTRGEADPYIKSIDDLLLLFIKVCDALAYAHSRNCVHQDIKPENILVSDYGQVFLIDWGASANVHGEMALTPAYMSPQQAKMQPPEPTDDVYCLGATLYHCLTHRFVADASSLKELWEKKKKGVIDPLPPMNKASVPPRLLAIAMMAIAAQKEDRYRSIQEFGRDLKNYRSGLAIQAYRDPILATVARLVHQYRYGMGVALSILIAAGVAYGFFHRLHQKEVAYWSEPVFCEHFEGDSWKDNWAIYQGDGEVRNGRMVSKGKQLMLFYKKRLYGSTAIEFDAEVLPGAPPGDLSALWSDDLTWSKGGQRVTAMGDHFRIQTGAWWNTFAGIVQRGKGLSFEGACLDHSDFRLKSGIVYKIRAEIDGHWIRLFVNGKLLCSHEALFPQQSGYVALYGFGYGKAFDNVRIYSKGVPQMTTATEVGDAFLQRGLYQKALKYYEGIVRSRSGGNMIHEARYKQGLCLWRLGKKAGAYKAWNGLEGTVFAGRISYHRVEDLYLQGKPRLALALLDTEYPRTGRLGKRLLRELWSKNMARLTQSGNRDLIEESLAMRDKHFPDDMTHTLSAASALMKLERYDEIEKKCPNQYWAIAFALRKLGRFQEVIDRCPHIHNHAALALLELGREEELLARYPHQRTACNVALLRLGRYHQIIDRDGPLNSKEEATALIELRRPETALKRSTDPAFIARVLLAEGRAEEVLANYGEREEECIHALMALGRESEVLKRYPRNRAACAEALFSLGRYHEIATAYFDQASWHTRAMIRLGRAKEAVLRHSGNAEACSYALAYLGRYEDIMTMFPKNRQTYAHALLLLGRYDQLLKGYPDQRHDCAYALLRKGMPGHVLERYRDQREACLMAMCQLGKIEQAVQRYYMLRGMAGMLRIRLGQGAKAIADNPNNRLIANTAQAYNSIERLAKGESRAIESLQNSPIPFVRDVLAPFSTWLKEPAKPFADYTDFLKKPDNGQSWQMTAFIAGHIKENEFCSATAYRNAEFLLAKAMRAEVQGQKEQARGLYLGYLRLLVGERPVSPLMDRFASWRARALRRK